MSYQLKLWDSKRERKLTGPNTLPAVRRTNGPSKSRGASRLQTGPARSRPAPPEAGGRRQGGGERGRLGPRTASPTALQAGLQFRTKDLLRFWMVDICREGRGETQGARTRPARAGTGGWRRGGKKAHAPDWRRRKLRLGPRRGEGAPHRGECARQAPGCLSRLGREGTKRGRSRVHCCGTPEGWNRAQLHREQPGA